MLSNYPPGVTGREYQIAGADFEEEKTETCETCLHAAEDAGMTQAAGELWASVAGTREYYQGGSRFTHPPRFDKIGGGIWASALEPVCYETHLGEWEDTEEEELYDDRS